jgi:hypothetical protein
MTHEPNIGTTMPAHVLEWVRQFPNQTIHIHITADGFVSLWNHEPNKDSSHGLVTDATEMRTRATVKDCLTVQNQSKDIVKTILQALESGEDGGEDGLAEYISKSLAAAKLEGAKAMQVAAADHLSDYGDGRNVHENCASIRALNPAEVVK